MHTEQSLYVFLKDASLSVCCFNLHKSTLLFEKRMKKAEAQMVLFKCPVDKIFSQFE